MSEQKIVKECKETEKVKVGSFEFDGVVVDAELVLARREASALKKIERLTRYRFDPDKKSIYAFLERPAFGSTGRHGASGCASAARGNWPGNFCQHGAQKFP